MCNGSGKEFYFYSDFFHVLLIFFVFHTLKLAMSSSERSTDSSAGMLLSGRSTQMFLSQLEKFPGTFYVNVNNADAFLVSMAYSKASIFFLCLIGSLTAFNTLTFTGQLTQTNVLCRLNDLLPIGKELRQIFIPVVYYCRFLEMSIATNILQLLFCLLALLCALNRRSTLFLLCYSFLSLMLFFGAAFLIAILVLNFETYILQAVDGMLYWELNNDSSFCQVLEPILSCRISPTPDDIRTQRFAILNVSSEAYMPHIIGAIDENSDVIEVICGPTRQRTINGTIVFPEQCSDYLTSFMMQRRWLIGLVCEYAFVIITGICVGVHTLCMKRTQRSSAQSSEKANSVAKSDAMLSGAFNDSTESVENDRTSALLITSDESGMKVSSQTMKAPMSTTSVTISTVVRDGGFL